MRGALILIAFFLLFTSASLLIQSPMFPGNFFCVLIGQGINEYTNFLSAILNGVFYAVVLWLVFIIISKRLGEQK